MANPEHFARLEEAVEKNDIRVWNNWRRARSIVRPDLSGADLAGPGFYKMKLSPEIRQDRLSTDNVAFRDLNLTNVDFRGANLRERDFRGVILSGSNLSQTDCSNTNFLQGNLDNVQFDNARLTSALFMDTSLRYATFCSASLHGACISGDLRHTEFIKAKMTKSIIVTGFLEETDFSYADLGESILFTSIYRANFTGANFQGARILRPFGPRTNLYGADFRKTKKFNTEIVWSAKNWQWAYYDSHILETLGLVPSHNKLMEEYFTREKFKNS